MKSQGHSAGVHPLLCAECVPSTAALAMCLGMKILSPNLARQDFAKHSFIVQLCASFAEPISGVPRHFLILE
jgi:hypothetical protein